MRDIVAVWAATLVRCTPNHEMRVSAAALATAANDL
jgi:hypothetical protein